ncbi:MAG: type I restriction enzyme HsdR N-terminal domain-containing protein [Bacteroidales bacterium]|jgi:type I site-specific restriction endonuclease|nr:type I restriction enzyme HsdR N-terminal domain-containing protein [Bacteroidales bacterium]
MIKTRNNQGITEIFDIVRKSWLQLTEEEKVRQYFIHFLIEKKSVPFSHIAVEKEIKVNGLSKRYDIVVFDLEGKPEIVIECKAPHIQLSQEVIEQVSRYNKTLKAPIIGITNGKDALFFKIDFETEQIFFIDDWR